MFNHIFSHTFNWQLAIVYAIVFLLMRIPYLGIHIKTINTFFHEIGHAIAALIFNGNIHHIKLNINNSGEALTATNGWFAKVFVSISGYLFPLFLGVLMLVFAHYKHLMLAFYSLFILAICATIMWVRNTYGYIWCFIYIASFALLIFYHKTIFIKVFIAFNVAALFTENVAASITLIKLAIKNPKQAGDAFSLKQHTYLPTVFWAFFFFLTSVLVLIASLIYDSVFKL